MHIVDIILKKRNGNALSAEEIAFVINGYVAGDLPDYQLAALMMAVWFRGMDPRETKDLTLTMMRSGDQIDLSAIPGIKVDKHSTGGVADTTTLVAAPLVAACGGKVAKMSGRGLGHTGGTLDKLESIPGFSVALPMNAFQDLVARIGLSVIGQTANLVPADKMLYALRDVTGTVDNLSLIASSIMSKKLASGSDAIVLDVKTGSGAFMQTPAESRALAEAMVSIGNMAGRKAVALVTDMNQPLGLAVGNALEVREAVEILQGSGGGDLKEVSLALAEQMLIVSNLVSSEKEARVQLDKALESGAALERFAMMIEAQGGDPKITEDTARLPGASTLLEVKARCSGHLAAINNSEIGMAALLLGAGRQSKTDLIDPAVGIWMEKRLGDAVQAGDVLATFHINDEGNRDEAVERFLQACEIREGKPETPPLIYQKVE